MSVHAELRPENAHKWVGERTLHQAMKDIATARQEREEADNAAELAFSAFGPDSASYAELCDEFARRDDRLWELREEANRMVAVLTGYTVEQLVEAGL